MNEQKPFVMGVTGVPGAGKTTLSMAVASQVRGLIPAVKVVNYVQEYARTYIKQYGIPTELSEQFRILQKQQAAENKVMLGDLVITDSPWSMGFLYSMQMRDPFNKKNMMILNDLFKEISRSNCPPHYDLIIHLPPILQPEHDGIRPDFQFEADWRAEADSKIRFLFQLFPPKKFVVLDSLPPGPRFWDLTPSEQKKAMTEWRVKEVCALLEANPRFRSASPQPTLA